MLTNLVRVKILTDALASVASVWIRACLSVYIYPHRAGLKNMPDHGGKYACPVWIYTRSNITQAYKTKCIHIKFESCHTTHQIDNFYLN